MTASSSARAARAVGAMILSAFGTAWLCWAAIVAMGGTTWVLAPIVAAGAGLLTIARRRFVAHRGAPEVRRADPRKARIARVFKWVNGAQWVLMIVLANVLDHFGLGAWIVPMIVFVIGLHFLPLAAVMGYRPHYVCGAALMIHALVSSSLPGVGPTSFVVPLGAGLILWANALYALVAGASSPKAVAVSA